MRASNLVVMMVDCWALSLGSLKASNLVGCSGLKMALHLVATRYWAEMKAASSVESLKMASRWVRCSAQMTAGCLVGYLDLMKASS
jgi:hypothetical protein